MSTAEGGMVCREKSVLDRAPDAVAGTTTGPGSALGHAYSYDAMTLGYNCGWMNCALPWAVQLKRLPVE
jgi:hypothetical protein